MEKRTTLIAAAVGGLISQLALHAQQPAPSPGFEAERCFGVARAGKNDCAGNGHSCAGQAKKDNDPNEWKHMPKDECEKMGGTTEAPKK